MTKLLKIKRTDSSDLHFLALDSELDQFLAISDGEEYAFYAQFNQRNMLKHVVVVYLDDQAVACGAFKEYYKDTVEIKRVFVAPAVRGKGLASVLLKELEAWAGELSYKNCQLETGKKQTDAVALYKKNGYRLIPNYGQYQDAKSSVCFEKNLVFRQQEKSED